jgi:hypothetical protein
LCPRKTTASARPACETRSWGQARSAEATASGTKAMSRPSWAPSRKGDDQVEKQKHCVVRGCWMNALWPRQDL